MNALTDVFFAPAGRLGKATTNIDDVADSDDPAACTGFWFLTISPAVS